MYLHCTTDDFISEVISFHLVFFIYLQNHSKILRHSNSENSSIPKIFDSDQNSENPLILKILIQTIHSSLSSSRSKISMLIISIASFMVGAMLSNRSASSLFTASIKLSLNPVYTNDI